MKRRAVIVNALRTPVGKMRQSLASVPALELAATVIKASIERSGLDPAKVDEVMFSNLMNNDSGSPAHMAWLAAGMPIEVSGVSIERRCASSLTALSFATMAIESGHADIVMTGGVDSYSQQPILMKRPEQAYPGTLKVLEVKRTPDNIGDIPMIMTAENLAVKYEISRQACDEFSYRSHMLASQAWSAGLFDEQVVPVTIPKKKGDPVVVTMDDCVRPDCSKESLLLRQ